ncbi:tetratricopeptide repeat protein [Fimbriiglobus ruber]|uniref:TPR-domain containing protein n=1 Tax=Fimbriiglobus ruber TaxID=1908690 RepID=A0A225DKR0_9BACT|nr:tetratricopeptide repeat protein [Fimbriiglobus ruber]OWK36737.1 TPR-domain containing protein [Fimbriiglobus ruber]
MTPPPRLRSASLAAFFLALVTGSVVAQQPMSPEQQAEVILTAARKGYNEGNLPFARDRFQEIVQKFANTSHANPARFGLAVCLINSPEQDFAKAAEILNGPANDGGFVDRAQAAYELGVCHRALGLKELERGIQAPNEAQQRKKTADEKFTHAAQAFANARDAFAGKKDDEKSARARCDVAEMEIRVGRVKEARNTCEPFVKDAALAKNKSRPLGLYYHGLACFQDKDYTAAGRSLNQVAPFTDPAFGTHARYLVARVLQMSGETAEAAVNYEAVLADYEKAKKDAAQALGQPDKFKNNPFEKARLEALAKGPVPEYVSGAVFHAAELGYEAGRFADALPKFQGFAKDFPTSPLQPDAQLRAGFCLVQVKQFDEAAKLLQPLVDKTPRLADQAQFWLGKAQVGLAQTADPTNPADRDNKLKAALDSLRKAAEKANQMAASDPDAKSRRHEILFDLADAVQLAKQYKEAAQIYEQLWNEQTALPARREEVLQRLTASLGAAGEFDRSNQRCDEYRKAYPQGVLTPAVAFRSAENSFARAVELAKANDKNRAAELKQKYDEAAGKFKEIVDKYPEFERVSFARFGIGVCLAQTGNLEEAVKAFDAIPGPDRSGDIATAAYLLADCLIRQAPAKADDALAENQMREKLSAAADLLQGFVAANPKAPEAPAALLKLGYCTKRLGATLADQNERNQTLNKAREVYEKLAKEYPKDPLAAQGTLELAKVRALAGDIGGAQNDLRQFSQNEALRQSPVAPLAALHLATLFRQQNNPAEAVKVLAEARQRYEGDLAKDPERAEWVGLLRYHHAVAVFETGKLAEARPLFEEVAKQSPGKPIAAEAFLRAAQCRIAEGKKLLEEGNQAKAQAGNDNNKKNAAEQKLQQGRQAINEAADHLLKRAEDLRGTLPTLEARSRMYYDAAWAWRAAAESELVNVREQVQKQMQYRLFEDAVRQLPPGAPQPKPEQFPLPEVPRAKIPLIGFENQSYYAYKRMIEEFPDSAATIDARFELAELKAERGENAEAAKLLKEALDKEPTDRPATPDTIERVRLRLGASLFAIKDYPASAAQFEAVAANPKTPYIAQALYRAGESLYAAGEFAKAAEKLVVFRDKGEFHNRDGLSDRALLRLGDSLAGAKQWDAARQSFETLIQRFGAGNAFAAEARYGIAGTLQNQSKYDEAVASYQQVIAATQAEIAAKAQLQVGQCRLAQKKYADAAAAFLTVPYTYDYPELAAAALLEAARAFAEDGKKDQAEKVLAKLIKDHPASSEWVKAAKERLEKLKSETSGAPKSPDAQPKK